MSLNLNDSLLFARLCQYSYGTVENTLDTQISLEGELASDDAELPAFCTIFTTASRLIVSFRGTQKEWLPEGSTLNGITRELALNVFPVLTSREQAIRDFHSYSENTYGGKVHIGFALLLSHLWDKLVSNLEEAIKSSKHIFFIGHSRGGALAVLASARLYKEHNTSSIVVSFGAPRVGDESFNRNFKNDHYRYELDGDLVPFTPLGHYTVKYANWLLKLTTKNKKQFVDIDFKHTGTLQWICGENILGHSDELTTLRSLDALVPLTWVGAAGKNHSIATYISSIEGIKNKRTWEARDFLKNPELVTERALKKTIETVGSAEDIWYLVTFLAEHGKGYRCEFQFFQDIINGVLIHAQGGHRDTLLCRTFFALSVIHKRLYKRTPGQALPEISLYREIICEKKPSDKVRLAALVGIISLERTDDLYINRMLQIATYDSNPRISDMAKHALA